MGGSWKSALASRGFVLLLTSIVSGSAALIAAAEAVGSAVPHWLDAAISAALALLVALGARLGLTHPALLAAALPPTIAGQALGAELAALAALGVAAVRAYIAAHSLASMPRHAAGMNLGADATLVQLATTAAVVVLLGAAGVYVVEGGRGEIKTYWDALWWAMATATTVGYGDVVPVTPEGRAIAIALMVFGIGFLGVFLSDMAARIARAMSRGEEELPILEREKRVLASRILRLEEVDDEELEIIINKVRMLHVLLRAGRGRVEVIKSMVMGPGLGQGLPGHGGLAEGPRPALQHVPQDLQRPRP